MAARREKLGIEFLLQPKLDQKATSSAIKDLNKQLASMKTNWNSISKASNQSIKELKNITSAAEAFSSKLSEGAKSSFKEFAKLSDQLEKAHGEASELQKRMAKAKSPGAKREAGGQLASVQKQIFSLNKQISSNKEASKGYNRELVKVVKAQKDYKSSLEKAASYTGKHMLNDITSGLKRGGRGGIGQILGGVGKAIKARAADKVIAGGGTEVGVSASAAGGDIAGAVMGIRRFVPVMAAAAAAVGAVWKILSAASDHQTNLNKALLDGTGTANDFTSSTKDYRGVIDELRESAQKGAWGMMKLGGSSEKTLSIINAFAKDSTGSLTKTRDTLASLGGGNVTKGMNEMARNAMAYGKALGMEATEVASMMGKFVSETGYSAEQVQGTMGNIVKAAATANMPMTKFMDIFRRVLPDVDLFTNRLEELTGVIKLLSSTMSPKDIQAFMDAFSKGFKGMSFKDRLGHVLVAGVGNVNKILQKDFSTKAKMMEAQFGELSPELGEAFKNAFASGDTKAMNDVLIKARAGGMDGTQIGAASKLFEAEKERKRGGALSTTSALKGGGMWASIKVMSAEMKRFGMGGRITGINEHVAEKRGYSQQQIDAMNQLISTMSMYQQSLKTYGTSGSKSMDKALRAMIAAEKGVDAASITPQDLSKATEEQIAQAAEASNEDKKTAATAIDLATEQVTATLSISEKLTNVIAFLLERLVMLVQPILDYMDDMWNWLTGSTAQRDMLKSTKDWMSKIDDRKDLGVETKEQYRIVSDMIQEGISSGSEDSDIAKNVLGSLGQSSLGNLTEDNVTDLVRKSFSSAGTGANDVAIKDLQSGISNALSIGDLDKAAKLIAELPGNIANDMTNLTALTHGSNMGSFASQEAKDQAKSRNQFERSDRKKVDVIDRADKRKVTDEIDDRVRDLIPLAEQMKKKPGSKVRTGVTSVERISGPAGSDPEDKPATAEEQKDATKSLVDSQEESTNTLEKGVEDVYDGVNDVLSLLKRGIILQSSFLVGPYQSTIKTATFLAFDQALVGFSTIMAKLLTDEDFAKQAAGYSFGIQNAGLSLKDLGTVGGGNSQARILQLMEEKKKGGRQLGGPIPDTGSYRLHKGEAVLDAMTYESVKQGLRGNGGGGGGTTVNMTINAAPNWTRQEFEGAVVGVMDKVARRT